MNNSIFNNKIIGYIPISFVFFTLIVPLLFLMYYALILPSNKPSESLFYYLFREPYLSTFKNTFVISIKVSFLSMLVSLFITYAMTTAKQKIQSIFLFIVIASMWLSILVRSYAWILILQNNGLVNSIIYLFKPQHSVDSLLYTQFSVVIGMVHILSPYVILIHWSGIKERTKYLNQISNSIGASPSFYFFSIYLPTSIKFLVVGGAIVFMLSLGYFITPLLLGKGGSDSLMITMLIEEQVNILANWKVGALISLNLLLIFSIIVSVFLVIPKFNKYLFNYLNEK